MSLPKISVPTYDLKLPLTKKNVKFRPFLVKEQKILLMAVSAEDSAFTADNIKEILKNCCLSEINIDKLPIVDIEYFFINLRARSVGETVSLKYRCQNSIDPDDNICGNLLDVNIDLLDININDTDIKNDIELTDSVGIKMKFPTYNLINSISKINNDAELAFDLIVNCIEHIYENDNIYNAKDSSKEELTEFLESLNIDQFNKIKNFFDTLPKLQKNIETTCNKCGFEHQIKIEGLENFLG